MLGRRGAVLHPYRAVATMYQDMELLTMLSVFANYAVCLVLKQKRVHQLRSYPRLDQLSGLSVAR